MVLLLFSNANSQVVVRQIIRPGIVFEGDTLPYYTLREVYIRESTSLLTEQEKRKHKKLIRNVKKMLPYAKVGKRRLDALEQQMASLPPKERRDAIKKAEKALLEDYTDELKDCTISQGKVLLKLIDRETGRTSYALVDGLRGKFRAGLYQTFARLFGYNLKVGYDPQNNKDDNLIERIVVSIEHGIL